jgi:hypothetical protein
LLQTTAEENRTFFLSLINCEVNIFLVHNLTVNKKILYNNYRFSDEFIIIPELSEEVIIGAKTLQAWRLKLDFENDEVIIGPEVTKLRLL